MKEGALFLPQRAVIMLIISYQLMNADGYTFNGHVPLKVYLPPIPK